MQQHAEEAERRKEGAKEETAAFERAVMDGNSAGFAGRDGLGRFDKQDDRARGDVVECWVRRDGGPERDPRQGARVDRRGGAELTGFEKGGTTDGGESGGWEVQKGDGPVWGFEDGESRMREKRWTRSWAIGKENGWK